MALLLCLLVALWGARAHAACVGECPNEDSGDSYLAKIARHSADRFEISEDSPDEGVPSLKAVAGDPKLLEMEAHMEKLLTGNATYTGTDVEVEALDVVRGYVDSIISATKKAHDENQGELNSAKALVTDCNTVAKTALDGRLTTQARVVTAEKSVHSQCRGNEVTLKATRDAKCQAYSDKKDLFGSSRVAGLGMCSGGSGDTSDDAIAKGYEWLQDLKAKMHACNGATTSHSDKRSVCGVNQSNYEKGRCFFKDKTNEVCDTLDGCYQKDSSFFTLRSQAVKGLEGIRKAEHASATRVLCYIDILQNQTGNKTEKLAKCKGAVSTSHLSITYPTTPSKYSCVRVTSAPCDADWVRTEYTTQTWHTKANTEACSACETPAPTPAPTEVALRPDQLSVLSFTSGSCSHEQNGHPCTAAYDGLLPPGKGWAFNGKGPTKVVWIELGLAAPSSVLGLKIYSCSCTICHLNDFAIEVSVGGSFQPVSDITLSDDVVGGSVSSNHVTCTGQELVLLTFKKVDSVTAVKIHVYGTDASNDNVVLAEAVALTDAPTYIMDSPQDFKSCSGTPNNWGTDYGSKYTDKTEDDCNARCLAASGCLGTTYGVGGSYLNQCVLCTASGLEDRSSHQDWRWTPKIQAL